MTTTRSRLSTLDAKVSSALIGLTRMTVGLLWLANLEWKRPPDFGRDLQNGLYKYLAGEIRNPVFGPHKWVIENIVLKQYTLFGWVTLITEVALAVLLLLGWKARIAALIGAVASVNIMLTVLYYDKQYEWPWSYYLMIAIQLLLFAVDSGRHLGLDGAVASGAKARARAVTVLGTVAIVVGAAGLYVARNTDVAAHQGTMLGWANGELKLLWFNPLGAALTIALGVLAVVGIRSKRHVLVLVASGGFAVMALQVIVQWRYRQGNWTGGVLGGTGGNLAFWSMLAVGLAVCALSGDRAGGRTRRPSGASASV